MKKTPKIKSESEPLVTVITITYELKKSGRESYFRQCLESVHNQTYKNLEHLVIDGASKDGSLELIKEFEKKGWIEYVSEPDKGIYDAMNKGIAKAKGKYITFLNSDDFYHNKKAVELSVQALESSGSDYSFADTQGIDSTDDSVIDIWRGNINLIPFGTHYCHQSMFVRTSVLKELGGFDTSYRVSADSDLMIKLVSLNKDYIDLPECIVSYRSGGLSNYHSQETRKEHSQAFYLYFGKDLGLTSEECSLIWNFSLFGEKNIFYCLGFGRKLKKANWVNEYYKRLFSFDNLKNQIKRYIPRIVLRPLVVVYKLIKGKK